MVPSAGPRRRKDARDVAERLAVVLVVDAHALARAREERLILAPLLLHGRRQPVDFPNRHVDDFSRAARMDFEAGIAVGADGACSTAAPQSQGAPQPPAHGPPARRCALGPRNLVASTPDTSGPCPSSPEPRAPEARSPPAGRGIAAARAGRLRCRTRGSRTRPARRSPYRRGVSCRRSSCPTRQSPIFFVLIQGGRGIQGRRSRSSWRTAASPRGRTFWSKEGLRSLSGGDQARYLASERVTLRSTRGSHAGRRNRRPRTRRRSRA